ncbi:MAG TPA: virulence RhuM family protein [Spirochaetota bacterium]|nr:virulence RhuM family protein [Spirochaetota bacterium]HPR50076.1 virulence RhuM family protein [Spirochaetota bacterium]
MKKNINHNPEQSGEIILYTTPDGKKRIDVRLENETVWLSQLAMSELFQTTKQNISLHLKNIFADDELAEKSVVKDYLTTASDGKKYKTKMYNLEAIIAVGYRVKSHRGVQFRQWATEKLKEYIVKGFSMDDERLAEPGGIDYFDELLERIRAIRASEKRFYQKVRDIYMTSLDYDPKNPLTQEFYAAVQNKMIYAATGMTAAELIKARANAKLPNMGLTTWKGAGRGLVLGKTDVSVSKNYLSQDEMHTLELLVGQYLDFAELQAKRRKAMTMRDWIEKLNSFLEVNEQEVLNNAGKVSAELAKQIAEAEYDRFRKDRILIEAEQADEELKNAVKQLVDRKKRGGDEPDT